MTNPCRVFHHAVSSRLFTESVAIAQCETHGMVMPEGIACTADTMCPIGRIEKATDEALAKIAAATGGIK